MQATMIALCLVTEHLKWTMKMLPCPMGLPQRSQLIQLSWMHGRRKKKEESFRCKSVIRSVINPERHENLKEQDLIRASLLSAHRLSPFPQPQDFQRPNKPLRHLNITLTHAWLPPGSSSTSLMVQSVLDKRENKYLLAGCYQLGGGIYWNIKDCSCLVITDWMALHQVHGGKRNPSRKAATPSMRQSNTRLVYTWYLQPHGLMLGFVMLRDWGTKSWDSWRQWISNQAGGLNQNNLFCVSFFVQLL